MQLSEKEIETVKALIEDRGFEYSLRSDLREVIDLARKLGMIQWANKYEKELP
jgi:uncharacterized radical SAM superfamily Fe-S cluster-containing enzyme